MYAFVIMNRLQRNTTFKLFDVSFSGACKVAAFAGCLKKMTTEFINNDTFQCR